MNISPFTIYLWQLADRLVDGMAAISILLTIYFVIRLVVYFVFVSNCSPNISLGEVAEDIPARKAWAEHETPIQKTAAARAMVMALSVALVSFMIPSSKTIAMMVIIPEIAHSKVVQQDLPDIYNAAVKALKDQLAK